MNTESRYQVAVAYVKRAIRTVEFPPTTDALEAAIEGYAGSIKTAPVRGDLERIERRWFRARSEAERSQIAREAELLADRTQENLPGAPQNRQRTNLTKGEVATSTPATSYAEELDREAQHSWHWLEQAGSSVATGTLGLAKLLLAGGAVYLGVKTARDLARRIRRAPTKGALNARLEAAAEKGAR